jgi:hypothetical protein
MYQIKNIIQATKGKFIYTDPKTQDSIDLPFFTFCVLCKLSHQLDFTFLYHDPSLLFDLYQDCFERVWRKKVVYENNLEKMDRPFTVIGYVSIYYASLKFLRMYNCRLKYSQISFIKHYEKQFEEHPTYLITEKGNYLDKSVRNISHFVKIQKSFLLLTSYTPYDYYKNFDTTYDHRVALQKIFLDKHFKEMEKISKPYKRKVVILRKIFFDEMTDDELLEDKELNFSSYKQMTNHKYLAIKKLRNFLNRGLPVIK